MTKVPCGLHKLNEKNEKCQGTHNISIPNPETKQPRDRVGETQGLREV